MTDTTTDTGTVQTENPVKGENVAENTEVTNKQDAPASDATPPQTATATPPVKGVYPDDWREQFAKEAAAGDEKLYEKELKRLQRFNSVADVYRSNRELERKLSSGEIKKRLGDKATPEEVAAYRKENGIPDDPSGYKIELNNGFVLGEADAPLVDVFKRDMHAINAPPEMLNAALSSYTKLVEQQAQELMRQDSERRSEGEEALRGEWGGDYKANLSIAASVLDSAPSSVRQLLWGAEAEGEPGKYENGARLADGSLLRDSPDVLRWLAHMGREMNPAATVLPSGGGNAMAAISDEKTKLEGMMGNRSSPYWKGPEADKLQARYRELIDIESKVKARGG